MVLAVVSACSGACLLSPKCFNCDMVAVSRVVVSIIAQLVFFLGRTVDGRGEAPETCLPTNPPSKPPFLTCPCPKPNLLAPNRASQVLEGYPQGRHGPTQEVQAEHRRPPSQETLGVHRRGGSGGRYEESARVLGYQGGVGRRGRTNLAQVQMTGH